MGARIYPTRQGESITREITRGKGCRPGRVSLISPCCEARSDVAVEDLLWYHRKGFPLHLHCGRSFHQNYRAQRGCDWSYSIAIEFSSPESDPPNWPTKITWIV